MALHVALETVVFWVFLIMHDMAFQNAVVLGRKNNRKSDDVVCVMLVCLRVFGAIARSNLLFDAADCDGEE